MAKNLGAKEERAATALTFRTQCALDAGLTPEEAEMFARSDIRLVKLWELNGAKPALKARILF
jgi:hypothetical protein